jgi:glycogen operon protein
MIPTLVAWRTREPGSEASLTFEVPNVPGRRWRRFVDTARPSPEDIIEDVGQAPLEADRVRVEGRSVLILLSG